VKLHAARGARWCVAGGLVSDPVYQQILAANGLVMAQSPGTWLELAAGCFRGGRAAMHLGRALL